MVVRLAAALICVSAAAARADEAPPAPRKMTLADALAFARAHHPQDLASRARVEAARAQAEIPGALWSPRLAANAQAFAATANNSTASYAATYGIDLVRVGGTKVTGSPDLAPDASTLAALGVRQELFDFGRIATLTAAAELGVDVELARDTAIELDVDLGVEDAFFAVRTAEAVSQTAEAAFARATVARDTAAAGLKSGLRRPIDLTRAEAELARYDVGRIRARSGVVSAQALFAAAVGVPDRLLDADGEPPAPPPIASVDAAVAAAERGDPALVAADAEARQQAAITRAIDAELRPDLSLTAAIDARAGGAVPSAGPVPTGDGLLPAVPNWDVGVVFSWPLLDGVVRARARASRQLEVARRADVDEERQRIAARVAQAYEALTVAQETLPALQRAVDAAHANYDQADARFKAGLDTQLELADAEALRTSAEIELAVGQFEAAIARARLGREIGERP